MIIVSIDDDVDGAMEEDAGPEDGRDVEPAEASELPQAAEEAMVSARAAGTRNT